MQVNSYFRLKYSLDIEAVGVIDQARTTKYFDPTIDAFDIDWFCPDFKLHHKAKITDFISHNFEGFASIVSERMYNLLNGLKIAPHQRFHVKLIKRTKVYDNYYFIHFPKRKEHFEMIDWNASVLYKYYTHTERLEPLRFQSYQEMWKFHESLWETKYQIGGELSIKSMSYDLVDFRFAFFPWGLICSQRCKDMLEESEFTGFRFEPVENNCFI